MSYANLHLHSVYSDSQFTLLQLVRLGKALGYKALALTDHETDGGVKDFITAANREGLDALPGVEFYANSFGANFHIVALDFDMENPSIRAFIKNRCNLMEEHTRKCFERGVQNGFIQGVTWNDVLDDCQDGMWICIEQVFRTLKRKKALSQIANMAGLRAAAFKGEEAQSWYPAYPSAEEVIGVIRKAGGIAVLAHPMRKMPYVEKLVELGLNGIEVSHPSVDDETSKLALEAAKTFNLYHSGGTDHTGPMSGCGGNNAIPTPQGITEEEFFIIKERRLDKFDK